MARVKTRKRSESNPLAERLTVLLDVFSPWPGLPLTYRQFAAEIGGRVTQAAVRKWPTRRTFPPDAARLIVRRAKDRHVTGVTLEWLLWGEGSPPARAGRANGEEPLPVNPGSLPPREEPHGPFAAQIAEALQADLSRNEFGQWSSVEVRRTVIWALKDLARRLRALQFDMGRTFELTDDLAGTIGLPVRPRGPSSEETADSP